MADKTKTTDKPKVVKKSKNIKKVPDMIAKILSQLALIIFAAYGLRELLNTINNNVAYVFTGFIILLLTYVIFRE